MTALTWFVFALGLVAALVRAWAHAAFERRLRAPITLPDLDALERLSMVEGFALLVGCACLGALFVRALVLTVGALS